MSVISTVTATPNRFLITFEYLKALGDSGEGKDHLRSQLQVGEGTSIIDGVLSEMKNLGLTEDLEKRRISLKKEFLKSSSKKIDSKDILYEFIFKKLINPVEARPCKQIEFPIHLGVLLSMDPYEPIQWSGDNFVRRKTKLFGQEIKLDALESEKKRDKNKSDAPLQNFVYWSKYLGFLSYITDKYFIPDPTEAMLKNLPHIFNTTKLTINEFQIRLGEKIPVLEGGSMRKEIESKLITKREENHFSKSTSLALKRLSKRGLIELESVSDSAKPWILDLGEETDQVSHIKYIKGK